MSSILLNTVNEITEKELETLGKTSNKCRTAGAHLVTVEKAFVKSTDTYEALTVIFKTEDGEELRVFEFLSTPKDDTPEAIQKAEASNKRTVAIVNRIAHASGMKDAKQCLASSSEEVDEKGAPITVFPKLANKKLTVISFTEIQTDKDDKKAYAVQEIDTFNFLDKAGKDGLGREIATKLGDAAKQKVEIAYGKDTIPVVKAKYAQVVEQLNSGTPVTVNTATPAAAATTEVANDEDI